MTNVYCTVHLKYILFLITVTNIYIKENISQKNKMGYSDSFATGHIDKWVNAWNNHGLKTVLSMYSDSVVFSRPKKVVFPERESSKITTKAILKGIGPRHLTTFLICILHPKRSCSKKSMHIRILRYHGREGQNLGNREI